MPYAGNAFTTADSLAGTCFIGIREAIVPFAICPALFFVLDAGNVRIELLHFPDRLILRIGDRCGPHRSLCPHGEPSLLSSSMK